VRILRAAATLKIQRGLAGLIMARGTGMATPMRVILRTMVGVMGTGMAVTGVGIVGIAIMKLPKMITTR
jgi:hypothetical protein